MSRKARIERDLQTYKENCISREPVEDAAIANPCAHAPGGNMIWGDPPEVFCRDCIHYQRGHVSNHEEET